MQITRKGVPTEVVGVQPQVGDIAKDFTLIDRQNQKVHLSDFKGKNVLISVFPDINTSVCDLQTRTFFKKAAQLNDVVVLNISNNTVEELQSWCATNGLDVQMLSDTNQTFANDYGLWMPEYKALARSVFVVNSEGIITYLEIVPEMAQEPNYQAALDALK